MTREEALKIWLPVIKTGVESMWECNEALDMAIKALKQEPCKCFTCKYGEWKRKGWDITMADDKCGGCCSWNDKYEPLEQEPCENWYDVPSDEMTLGQARQAVKDLRKMWAGHLWQEPCEDCISRQAALDAFGLSEKSRKYGGDHSGYDTIMLYEVQDALEALPSVLPKLKTGHWIPVSERLPESDDDVLVTNSRGMYIGWINPTDKVWRVDSESEYFMKDIIAWMPLPKPYKIEEGEEK